MLRFLSGVAAVWVMTALVGCSAWQRPLPEMAISPDGRTVAFLVPAKVEHGGREGVVLVDRGGFSTELRGLPGGWSGNRVMWMGGKLYVQATKGREQGGWMKEEAGWRGVPALRGGWYPVFTGKDGAVYVPGRGRETEVFGAGDFGPAGRLEYAVRGVGDGYMLRYQWEEEGALILTSQGMMRELQKLADGASIMEPGKLAGMELLDPERRVVARVERPEGAGVVYKDGRAQISPDHRALMIAPEANVATFGMVARSLTAGEGTVFAVYDVGTGKVVYSTASIREGKPPAGQEIAAVSVPVLMNDGVYVVEKRWPRLAAGGAEGAESEFWLCRYTGEGGGRREELVRLPLEAGGRISTTASAKGGFMEIFSYEPRARMVEVPLKVGVKEGDLRYFNGENWL